MPKFIVETVSIFKMRYLVEADQAPWALDTVVCDEGEEFDQHHLCEQITGIIPVSDETVLRDLDSVLPLIDPEKEAERLLKNQISVIIDSSDTETNAEGC
jgi:hypothetical protein